MSKFICRSVSDLLGAYDASDSQMLDIDALEAFKNHPFKVIDNTDMTELAESIRDNGIITPILVRKKTSAQNEPKSYEIISGHRRVHAAKLAGLSEVPAIVKSMTDDEATITMVNANMQRKEILPSERAWSLKMKYEAMKHQGKRSDLTTDQNEPKLSSEELGASAGMSSAQVKRYIKLTDLIPGLMDHLDAKRINTSVALDLSFLDVHSQESVLDFLGSGHRLSGKQAKILRDYNEDGTPIDVCDVEVLIKENDRPKRKFSLSSKKIDSYFPNNMSEKEIETLIIELLDRWKEDKTKEDHPGNEAT